MSRPKKIFDYLAYHRDYMKKYNQTLVGKYTHYKIRATKDKMEWKIDKKDFEKLWKKPCYYCGAFIETIGIDRINNKIGYLKNNIVPCCAWCNKAKLELLPEQFIEHCKKVASFQQ